MANRIHAAGVLLENEDGEILVFRRQPQNPEGNTWGLTGGKIKEGENTLQALLRKVHAEIGYDIDPGNVRFVKTYHWDREDMDLIFDVFRLTDPASSAVTKLAADAHSEYLWATPQELYARKDLMQGLYPILEDTYGIT